MKKISFYIGFIALCQFIQAQNAIINSQFISMFPQEPDTVNVMANNSCEEGHILKIYSMPGAGFPGTIIFWNDSLICFSINPLATDTVIPVRTLIREKYYIDDQSFYTFYTDTTWVTLLGKTWIGHLDINDVSTLANADGYLFNDLYRSTAAAFEVPKGSGKSTIYSSALWLGAFDQEGVVHISAQQYYNIGQDYYPGPISWNYDSTYKSQYQTIWTLKKSEIEFHEQHWQDAGYIPSEKITSWPGNGNPQNGQMEILAPFYDRNHNLRYEPQMGDYPLIRGDEAIYFIFNDARVPQGENLGLMLGAEVHGMLYAFSDTNNLALSQTVFLNYSLFNRSQNDYNNLYIGSFIDFDIGGPGDDFVGCDTLLNLFYCYNADDYDENISSNFYGYHPPAQGALFLNHKMQGFSYFSQDIGTPTSDPQTALEFYYYLINHWRDGSPMTYGGSGYGGLNPVNYMFPGDPSNPNDWSDVTSGFIPGDRRGLGTLGPFNFAPGERICIDMAFPYARDNNGTNLTSVTVLKQRAAAIQAFYNEQNFDCPDIVLKTPEIHKKKLFFKVFPNPTSGKITIKSEVETTGVLEFYSAQGTLLFSKKINGMQTELNLGNLTKGIYLVKIKTSRETQTQRLVLY